MKTSLLTFLAVLSISVSFAQGAFARAPDLIPATDNGGGATAGGYYCGDTEHQGAIHQRHAVANIQRNANITLTSFATKNVANVSQSAPDLNVK